MKQRREIEPREEMKEEQTVEEMPNSEPQQKFLLVLSSSYGISALVHMVLIIVLMFIYLVKPVIKKPPVIISRAPEVEQPIDETKPLMLHKKPPIDSPKPTDSHVDPVTPDPVVSETPQGTSLDNPSNKNLNSNGKVDAYGPGGGRSGAYGLRSGKGKWNLPGSSIGCEGSVQAALLWLKRHQTPQGNWKSSTYDDQCKGAIKCKNEQSVSSSDKDEGYAMIGRGMDGYDAGVTGLATLAFLGNGHTHTFGRFKAVVRKSLEWMQKIQVNDPSSPWHGTIGFIVDGQKVEHPEWIYNHAICTMALCEAYAITKDPMLKDYAQRAVDFCVKAQNPGLGWRYDDSSPEKAVQSGRNDTSVTGWMVLALKAARHSGPPEAGGLIVPSQAFEGALKWFSLVTNSNGKAGYMSAGGESSVLAGRGSLYGENPTNTAVSVLCRIFSGQSPLQEDIQKGSQILMGTLPLWERNQYKTVNMYYWYYGTYAMFQMGGKNWDCGKSYETQEELSKKNCHCWNHSMQKSLILNQRQKKAGDCAYGSWDPIGEWGIAGGRVYATAMGALTLEIYYRYERLKK